MDEHIEAALMAAGAQMQAKDAEISALLDRVALLRSYLVRYRKEVPLGHQPHMLAHLVDDALGRPNAMYPAKPAE